MKKNFLLSMLVFFGGALYAQAQVSNLTAAELALHRLEKLVTLNRVDPEYQSNFWHLGLTRLNPVKPTDPAFKVILSQNAGKDGLSDMVEIQQDKNGKALSHKAMVHTSDPSYISWPQKDPVTTSELVLHYFEDHYNPNDNSKIVFGENLSELVIAQELDQTGKLIAVVTLKNSLDTSLLVFRFSADGKYISHELKI